LNLDDRASAVSISGANAVVQTSDEPSVGPDVTAKTVTIQSPYDENVAYQIEFVQHEPDQDALAPVVDNLLKSIALSEPS
jgi:hypothetical protein